MGSLKAVEVETGGQLSVQLSHKTQEQCRDLCMTDSLLAPTDIEEALSRVYAQTGHTTADYSQDRDGIDILIRAGGQMRPALDIQLKAPINLVNPSNGFFHYPLRSETYNLLCVPSQTQRLLA